MIGFDIQEQGKAALGEKSVWVVGDKMFSERHIKVGVSDETYYEVLEGLAAGDKVLIDVQEKDALADLYKKAMRKF